MMSNWIPIYVDVITYLCHLFKLVYLISICINRPFMVISIQWCHLTMEELPLSRQDHFNGLVQDCSKSIANAMELLQSCTKTLILWLPYLSNGNSFTSKPIFLYRNRPQLPLIMLSSYVARVWIEAIPITKCALFSTGTHIFLMKSFIIMFPVCPIWFQDPILKMLSSNRGCTTHLRSSEYPVRQWHICLHVSFLCVTQPLAQIVALQENENKMYSW